MPCDCIGSQQVSQKTVLYETYAAIVSNLKMTYFYFAKLKNGCMQPEISG
jgi:hypothetical protein